MKNRTAKSSVISGATYLVAFCLAPFVMSNAVLADAITTVSFYGLGINGSANFTIVPNVSPPDPNPLCGTAGNNPCRTDPPGAYKITNVTGTFSDANIGIVNASITGLVPINPANERDPTFDGLVPASLSFIDPAGLSYNNLFFANGSPIDCDFPFSGTLLDVFGTAFTITGGDTVNFWGDGNYNFGPLTYGVGVTEEGNPVPLDYQFAGISVPEPLTLSLFSAGLFGVVSMRRRKKKVA